MFKLVMSLALLAPTLVMATADAEKIQIKEVKSWVKKNGKESTCTDEYLSRRKQLSWQMSLAPVTIAGSVVSGFVGGGLLGHGAFLLTGQPNEGFTDLAYTVGGGVLGVAAGAAVGVTTGTLTTINFFNNQRLIKVIFESRTLSENEHASTVLHQKYLDKYPEDILSIQVFKAQIAELDLTGKLCDGSIVTPKRFKKGKKLKQRLATRNEIFNHIHEELVKGNGFR